MNINPNLNNYYNTVDKFDLDNKVKNIENKEDQELKEVCQEFESIFLYMMMKEMRKNVPEGGLIERSQASQIFEEMYMEELSKEISRGEGIGLADSMYEQLKQDQRVIL